MALSPGSMLERYEILRLVGRGGMGEVYHALDSRLRRPVALKVLRADKNQDLDSGGVARLLREARTAASFNHPNSVAIYELGEAEGVAFIAMELVIGESFRLHCANSKVGMETKLGWLIDAGKAIWAAHKASIVHRDIKPSNMMVSEEGVVKVLDFGLAKPSQPGLDLPGFQTAVGQVLGTPRYMAPEQLEGKTPDGRSDQFSFGITAYELLCNHYPGGPLGGAPPPMSAFSVGIPQELDRVVLKMMERKPEDRFATMEDVVKALMRALSMLQKQWEETTTRGMALVPPMSQRVPETMRIPSSPVDLHNVPATAQTLPLARTLAMPLPPNPPSNPSNPSSGPQSQSHHSQSQRQSSPRVSVSSSQNFPAPLSQPTGPMQPVAKSSNLWLIVVLLVTLSALLTGTTLAILLR